MAAYTIEDACSNLVYAHLPYLRDESRYLVGRADVPCGTNGTVNMFAIIKFPHDIGGPEGSGVTLTPPPGSRDSRVTTLTWGEIAPLRDIFIPPTHVCVAVFYTDGLQHRLVNRVTCVVEKENAFQ